MTSWKVLDRLAHELSIAPRLSGWQDEDEVVPRPIVRAEGISIGFRPFHTVRR
jgi:hypothetical protein